MTDNEVLSLNLTKERKEAILSYYTVMNRLKKSTEIKEITDKKSADQWIDALILRKQKAEKAKALKEQKKAIKEEEQNRINEVVMFAKEAGLSIQDIINAVMVTSKAKYNEKIEAEIEALKAQLEQKMALLYSEKM